MGERVRFRKLVVVIGMSLIALKAYGKEEPLSSVEKLQRNIQEINENLEKLSEAMKLEAKNLDAIQLELEAKRKAQTEVKKNLSDTETALNESYSSEKDFKGSLNRDQELVENTKEEIGATKVHLSQLEENLKILKDNLEIDRDNIEKILKSRDLHERNLKNYRQTLDELARAGRMMEAQSKGRKESLSRNEQELKRWKRLLELRMKDLERMQASAPKATSIGSD